MNWQLLTKRNSLEAISEQTLQRLSALGAQAPLDLTGTTRRQWDAEMTEAVAAAGTHSALLQLDELTPSSNRAKQMLKKKLLRARNGRVVLNKPKQPQESPSTALPA